MDLTKHCQLCENQLVDIQTGTTCALTNKPPDFREKCPDIRFEDKYEEKIREINIEYDKVRRTRGISYANFFFYITISIVIMVAGYLIGKYALEKGVISTVPLIIMGVGVLVLPMAAGPLNKYRTTMKIARKKLTELNELLAIYNIQYTIDVIVNKDRHGNEDIETKLFFQRKHHR